VKGKKWAPGPKKARATPEEIAAAGRPLRDGASYAETTRTTGVSHEKLREEFPGMGWTYRQGGEYRALVRVWKVRL
jgi:hypothetical protein